ncbi:MAG TPA: DUF1800 domain-containing protein [Gemmatimonadaceae bacterium]|nr:DUF1800 domain-containing protein [Gemmatimonadaceae bacterium]
MSSRRFLVAFLALLGACVAPAARLPQGSHAAAPAPLIVVSPTEPREQTADQQVEQVLNRLAFGPRPGDVGRVREMGVDRWIALQLAPERIDDHVMDSVVATSYEGLDRPTSDIVADYVTGQQALRRTQAQLAQEGDSSAKRDLRSEVLKRNPELRDQLRRSQRALGELQSARLARAVGSERQLQEVMTDFWENHFSVFAGKGVTRLFLPAYDRDVIRPHALGKFRDLLGAVAKSPAMLFYLDQWQSTVDTLHPSELAMQARTRRGGRRAGAMPPARPAQAVRARRGLNENYARELMELHTLGVDGGYTQQDVIEVARALTGWTMNPRQNADFVFRPAIHDAGEKVVLGHRLPAGRGIEDGENVLDILARDPHTAHFIARKLAIRFVSDDPPPALVERAAQVFLRTDGDIRETVRTIVTSPEFFSRAAYRSKVKSPFELVASSLRALGARPDTSMRSAQVVAFLGQPMFGHRDPNGWPETGEAWMNSGAILNRINFGAALAGGRLPNASVAQWSDAERLRGAPREQQVDAVVDAFLGGHVSPDTRQILMDGENPLARKLAAPADTTSAAMTGSTMTDPSMQAMRDARPTKGGAARPAVARGLGRPVQLNGLAQVVGLAIGAPEFQRR